MTYGLGPLFFYSILRALSCILLRRVCVRKMHIFSHSSPAVTPQLHLRAGLNLRPVHSSPRLSTPSAATTTPILAEPFDLQIQMNEAKSTPALSRRSPARLHLCHHLTLEVFLQELQQFGVHPTPPPPPRGSAFLEICAR